MGKQKFRKIGRDAGTGHFKSVDWARNHPKTAVVEKIPIPPRRKK
jgi:hypothetical protein